MRYGYARVSSNTQDYAAQVDALKAGGCARIFSEKASGKSTNGRPELAKLMKVLQPGDAVVVTKSPEGHVKLNQLFHPVKSGAVSGLFWGTLVGLLFMMPLVGAAVGAASGAISDERGRHITPAPTGAARPEGSAATARRPGGSRTRRTRRTPSTRECAV